MLMLLTNGCATKTKLMANAKQYQEFSVANSWTSEVGQNPEMAAWKVRIAEEGWTETVIDDLIDYLQKLMLYAPVGKCGGMFVTCSPGMFTQGGYIGLCTSCGSYVYHTFKYLGYPRSVRIGYVRVFGVGHQVTRIEREDGSFRMINSYDAFGLHYLDEPFYWSVIDFDDERIYE